MFKIPWYSILLITIPQIFFVIKLGMRLFNLEIENRNCLLISIIAGCVVYILRTMPIIPGIHTVVSALVIILLVTTINHTNIVYALVCILLGLMIFGAIEGAWLPLFLAITSSSLIDLKIHPWLNIIGFYPILTTAIAIYYIAKQKKLILFDLKRLGQADEKK